MKVISKIGFNLQVLELRKIIFIETYQYLIVLVVLNVYFEYFTIFGDSN